MSNRRRGASGKMPAIPPPFPGANNRGKVRNHVYAEKRVDGVPVSNGSKKSLGESGKSSGSLQSSTFPDFAGEAGPIGILATLGHRRGQPLVNQFGQRHRHKLLVGRL